jgi:uncharacterized protein YybS (DUF2232 family)
MIAVMERPRWLKGPVYHLAPLALSAFFFYASVALPLALALAPAPLYWALARHGRGYGLTAAIGAAMAVFIISGLDWALAYTAICVMMALAASEAFSRGSSLGVAVGAAAVLPFLASLGVFAVIAQGSGGVNRAAEDVAGKAVGMVMEKQASSAGGKDAAAVPPDEARKALVWAFSSLFPALLFNMTLFLAFIQHLVSRGLSMKYQWGVHAAGHDLARWRTPSALVWALAAGAALTVSGVYTTPAAVGLNVVFVLALLYAFHGLSVVHYWMEKSGMAAPAKALVFTLLFIANPWTGFLLCLLGLTDVWLDFRSIGAAAVD